MTPLATTLAVLVGILGLTLFIILRKRGLQPAIGGRPVYSPTPIIHTPKQRLQDHSIEYLGFDPMSGPVTKEVTVDEVVRLAILEGRSLSAVKDELGVSDEALLALVEMIPDWLKAGKNGGKEN